ncbi:MAG TPA: hypothetical protein VLR88_05130 [Propionibacteriaceae bacterium]|nr:hypothetical protein [Propionibacteriaceae bacterium]
MSYTDSEKDLIRRGALGAMSLVAQADPGFIALFKESAAGSKALASAPDSIKDLLSGGMVTPPQATSKEGLKAAMLADVSTAAGILGREPADLAAFKDVIGAVVAAVADASKGTSANEQTVIDDVLSALNNPASAPAPAEPETPDEPAIQLEPPVTLPTPGDGGLTMDPNK